jgi:hypothetical protein
MTNERQRLKSDPKREAVASLHGYAYQIWQSLYRWLHLDPDESLFLEGAEDIDSLGPGSAETIQVKVSGRISLQSKPALEAIANLWQHQRNNPDTKIFFRLLTTARRTYERSKPCGNIKGLDYWDRCRFPQTDLTPLRTFLQAQDSFTNELRRFVVDASDDDFREQLITRIEWDTNSKPLPFISDLIKEKLVTYGYHVHSLPPSDSEKVLPILLKHVWDVVLEPEDRSLRFSDFMRIFEEAVSELITKTELRRLREGNRLRGLKEVKAVGPPEWDLIFEAVTPPTNDRLVLRSKLISELLPRLNAHRVLALSASSGMGKSVLANSVCTVDRMSWRRISFRGLNANEIRDRLRYGIHVIEQHPNGTSFILDDLNFDQDPLRYEDSLANFIYTVMLRSGRILITTQDRLPHRIVNEHDLPLSSNVDVPPFDDDDIQSLASNHGCPAGHKLKAWSRIIRIQTSGHPLLAHARIKALETKEWPQPTQNDLFVATELSEIRREIRARLRELLPSDEARLLAYRLSVFSGRFRRFDALNFGKHEPSINSPGEAFDKLIGPWVERAGDVHFRLSPLLDNAATENFTPEEVRSLHKTAAESFVGLETISPLELGSGLFHGLISEAIEPLAKIAMCMFQIEEKHWPGLRLSLDWFSQCKLQEGEKLLPTNPLVSTLLRRLQFKLINKDRGDDVLRIITRWEREIEEWDGANSHPGSRDAMRLMFLTDVLFSFETPLQSRKVVEYLVRAIRLGKVSGDFFPGYELTKFSNDEVSRIFNGNSLVGVSIARLRTAEAVIEFLQTVGDEETDEGAEITTILRDDDRLAALLIDQMWIAETKESPPNWVDCTKKIDWVIEFSLRRKLTAIAAAAFRAKATVLEEYLHDCGSALDVVAEGEAKLRNKHLVLEDYRAKILVMEKRFEEALSVWEEAVSTEGELANPVRTFSHRDAEICAGQLGDWKKAYAFARAGAEAARQMLSGMVPDQFRVPEIELMVTGFKADQAFAFWKLNDKPQALKAFADVLADFERLPDPNTNIKSNMLHKRVAYAIGWFNHNLNGNTEVVEPPPGCFSNPEVHEAVNDLPVQALAVLWFLLAKVEYKLESGDTVFQRFEEVARSSDVPEVKAGHADLLMDHSLRSPKRKSLVSTFIKCFSTVRNYAARRGVKNDQLSLNLVLMSYLFAAIIRLIRQNAFEPALVADWRTDAIEQGIMTEALHSWLTVIEKSDHASQFDLVSALKSTELANEIRVVAALILSSRNDLNPEDRFYANVVLATTNLYDNWLGESEQTIGDMVANAWLLICENERFSLRSPNTTADLITSACRDNSCFGLKKASRVLLAARPAVRTSVADDILTTLKERAEVH